MASSYRRVASADLPNSPTSIATQQEADGVLRASSFSSTTSSRGGNTNNNATNRANTRSLGERLMDKIIALAWVLFAALIAYWTRFFHVVLLLSNKDDTSNADTAGKNLREPNRVLLHVAAVAFGIQTVLFLYLSVYLPKFKGLTDSSAWPVYCPRVIPTMTFLGVAIGLVLIRATWPVWGFRAPLILGIEFLGFLFSLHFVPWFC